MMSCYLKSALTVLLLSLLATAATAQESCLKLVFNKYCLGGDINLLARNKPGAIYQETQGERFGLVYPEGRDKAYVMAFRGRIYKVLLKQEPATYLKYQELLDLMNRKYGHNEDRSQVPSYVKNRAGFIGAIRRGDGRAVHRWQAGGQEWRIELSWNREMGLTLAYIADSLDAQQQDQQERGY